MSHKNYHFTSHIISNYHFSYQVVIITRELPEHQNRTKKLGPPLQYFSFFFLLLSKEKLFKFHPVPSTGQYGDKGKNHIYAAYLSGVPTAHLFPLNQDHLLVQLSLSLKHF